MKGLPHEWLLEGLDQSCRTLVHVLHGVTQEQAQSIRDGADGWSVLEILCHLRDYQAIFVTRVERLLDEVRPRFEYYDERARLAMVLENDYAGQNLAAVLADFCATRDRLIARLAALSDEQWTRVGEFADGDEIDVAMPVVHTILHDADHTEQIARILLHQ